MYYSLKHRFKNTLMTMNVVTTSLVFRLSYSFFEGE